MITDEDLLCERTSVFGGGKQRLYRFPSGFGLSAVNEPRLHDYPFAWEIAVVEFTKYDTFDYRLVYDTELTSDVEIFSTDEEANAFIQKAKELLSEAHT